MPLSKSTSQFKLGFNKNDEELCITVILFSKLTRTIQAHVMTMYTMYIIKVQLLFAFRRHSNKHCTLRDKVKIHLVRAVLSHSINWCVYQWVRLSVGQVPRKHETAIEMIII